MNCVLVSLRCAFLFCARSMRSPLNSRCCCLCLCALSPVLRFVFVTLLGDCAALCCLFSDCSGWVVRCRWNSLLFFVVVTDHLPLPLGTFVVYIPFWCVVLFVSLILTSFCVVLLLFIVDTLVL